MTLAQTTTSSTGSYATSFPAPAIGSYAVRALAQQVRTSGKLHGQVVTDTKTLRVVAQTASLSLPKTLVQAAAVTATVKFAPARPGRAVALQVLESGVWTPLATGSQSSNGSASFTLTAGIPGTYSYRAWTAASGGAPAFAGQTRILTITPAAPVTTVSTGGPTTVRLQNVTVVAAAGAIAAGQTLTLARSTVPRTETPTVPSLIGGTISLSSSQGEPQGPVTITFTLAPGQLGAGRKPLLLHQEAGGQWSPELAVLAPDGRTVIVTVDHFSFFELVDQLDWSVALFNLADTDTVVANVGLLSHFDFDYAFGLVSGNRAAVIDNCGSGPSWYKPVTMPQPVNDLNAALWACPDLSSSETDLKLRVANNRGYAQVLEISGAVVDTKASFVGSSVLETVELSLARLNGGESNASEVFIPGGAQMVLVLHRPSGPAVPVNIVDIVGTPKNSLLMVGILWTILQKLSLPVELTAGTADCALQGYASIENSAVGIDPSAIINLTKSCLTTHAAALGMALSKATETALVALGWIATALGVTQQLDDAITQGFVNPGQLEFTLAGNGRNDVALAVSITTQLTAVAGQPYEATLSATGGTAPLTWSVTAGSLPPGLELSAAGNITGTPTTPGSTNLTVTVHDSLGATATTALTLVVTEGDGGPGTIRAGSISAGGDHSCAVTTAGAVRCWGEYLAVGAFANATTPVDVAGLGSGVASVSAGSEYSCAVTTGGAVKCWGVNFYGQLGDGTNTNSTTPVGVVGLGSGVASVSAGFKHACAVTTGGAVKCWGSNVFGQLGDGTHTSSTTPVDVVGLGSGVAAVSAGENHSCALTTSGAVKCWGRNGNGELGNGLQSPIATSSTPWTWSGWARVWRRSQPEGTLRAR